MINASASKLLLVEGRDDKSVVSAICKVSRIDIDFDIIDCGGVTNALKLFGKYISRMPLSRDLTTVGVIVDADQDIGRRFNEIKTILRNIGCDIDTLPATGLILNNVEDEQRIGIWIMPDNNTRGMLEDFIKFLVPPNDVVMQSVEEHLNSIEKHRINRYSPIHRQKAVIHSWLALQEDPGMSMGASITRKVLATRTSESCKLFVEWMNNLFR
ncbi:MAG: hypothetical protein LBO69_07490 [Ignavibacteria bacterium]|jgi:hypothetical protein|nr:hypothetical protein [Ignavibacteria bacterium]